MYDYHAHTNYSDGAFLRWMVDGAAEAGLDGIGFADHCNVSPEPSAERYKRALGFNLDLTHERRREAIEAVRADAEVDVDVFDAVEMDYDPDHEPEIAQFLDDAGFDYAVGSVHELDGANVHTRSHFADKPESEREELVDRYFEKLVELIESELFAIAAHPDLIERNPHLRGFATEDHYAAVVDAFGGSRTVPEVNAGRLLGDYGEFHPAPAFLDRLVDAGIEVTIGTDSHEPDEIAPRVREIEAELDRRGLEPVRLDDIVPDA
ncbi:MULTISPECIES: PHP domain-containing protein [Halorubrum]|uniref:histidinol-phosphatase n=1 Tax=Halorubrum hochstenium ATCC 700873 TaxID=1227481 RepID=M0FQM8_9EURY|nr:MULTISPECIES: PHP domain-containing protein [Halorubrum]ELZ61578.1 histidinol phosphate phosphatase HisJ family protein [Halorubrum hochstenium ATCC 700873]